MVTVVFVAKHTVDGKLRVSNDLLDDTPLLEVGESLAGERSVDLQSVDENGGSDESVGEDVLVETLLHKLVHDHGMLGLVLDYSRAETISAPEPVVSWVRGGVVRTLSFGPLLLLLLSSLCCGGSLSSYANQPPSLFAPSIPEFRPPDIAKTYHDCCSLLGETAWRLAFKVERFVPYLETRVRRRGALLRFVCDR